MKIISGDFLASRSIKNKNETPVCHVFLLLGTTRGSRRFTATRNSTGRNWCARSLYWSCEPNAASGEYAETD